MANQVDQRFVLFKNDKYIKAKKADGSQIDLFKVNASDKWEFAVAPEIGGSALQTESQVDAKVLTEKNRAEGVEATIVSSVTSEASTARAAESALSGRISTLEADPTTKTYVDGKVDLLQGEISNIISNVDPASLDSLTEIVAAFQSADGNLLTAINNLGSSSGSAIGVEQARAEAAEAAISAALAQEITDRQDSEAQLQSNIDDIDAAISDESARAQGVEQGLLEQITNTSAGLYAEMVRATDAEQSIENALQNEVSRATISENSLSSRIDDEESRAISAESALSGRVGSLEAVVWFKEKFSITNGQTSVTLSFAPKANSVSAFVDRLAIHEGASEDYAISGSTVTFLNDLVSPGQSQIGNGDTVYVKYQK